MNKIIRLCLSKYTNVNGVLNFKIEGALFIVHNLNASKAYGYHLKKQGGNSIGEYNLIINSSAIDENYEKIEITSEDIFDSKCKCGSEFSMKDCCLNFEWTTEYFDIDSNEYTSAFSDKYEYDKINESINEIRDRYIKSWINIKEDDLNNNEIFCPKEIKDNLKEIDNLCWLELSEISKSEFKFNKIDVEYVSEVVPGNMVFLY